MGKTLNVELLQHCFVIEDFGSKRTGIATGNAWRLLYFNLDGETRKILSTRNLSILTMSSSGYNVLVFRIRELLHKICIFVT